jgi:hypothetical protein
MRGRFGRVSDRAIGIALGVLLGLLIIVLFLFLGSRSTIDEPSISGGTTTQNPPTPGPATQQPKPPK